jgi:hypothetical protein
MSEILDLGIVITDLVEDRWLTDGAAPDRKAFEQSAFFFAPTILKMGGSTLKSNRPVFTAGPLFKSLAACTNKIASYSIGARLDLDHQHAGKSASRSLKCGSMMNFGTVSLPHYIQH